MASSTALLKRLRSALLWISRSSVLAAVDMEPSPRSGLARQSRRRCYVDMRIVITGDTGWECRELASRVLRRLVARYGPDIVIIHGNEPGVDSSFAAAAKEMGLTAEARVIDRSQTCFPTVGARNRELLLGGADLCIAVHSRIAACPRTLDCVRQALQDQIPTYGIENVHAIPRRIKRGDTRLR